MTVTTTRAAETWARILAQPDGYPMGIAADFATDDGSEPHEACAAVEAVAQQHLDARPDDHRARRLLGEWLMWHGDKRGEGYRALAAFRRNPDADGKFVWLSQYTGLSLHAIVIRADWWRKIRRHSNGSLNGGRLYFDTRRAAEDAAAIAFARLPAERREQLLKGDM